MGALSRGYSNNNVFIIIIIIIIHARIAYRKSYDLIHPVSSATSANLIVRSTSVLYIVSIDRDTAKASINRPHLACLANLNCKSCLGVKTRRAEIARNAPTVAVGEEEEPTVWLPCLDWLCQQVNELRTIIRCSRDLLCTLNNIIMVSLLSTSIDVKYDFHVLNCKESYTVSCV